MDLLSDKLLAMVLVHVTEMASVEAMDMVLACALVGVWATLSDLMCK